MAKITILHFSDVLCVWAYIAQIRVKELQDNFPEDVEFVFRYFSVFGDIGTRMASQWAHKGGIEGYAAHVQEVAAQFDHVKLNPSVWRSDAPTSSMPAHLFLCAARCLEQHEPAYAGSQQRLDGMIRSAFFEDNLDISNADTLLQLVDTARLPIDRIQAYLRHGEAHAAAVYDSQQAKELAVRASPALTFNEGRQMLTGNVGYRVLEANIVELLSSPQETQSWC